ncbi:tyrosine-type recombinase/integrase [Sideroxydans sp.]
MVIRNQRRRTATSQTAATIYGRRSGTSASSRCIAATDNGCPFEQPALFNLAIDSKLRACDLVKLKVRDISHGEHIASRATVMQQKTQRPVQFEITDQTKDSVGKWIASEKLRLDDFLFQSRISDSPHLSTRQYARIVHGWVEHIGLDTTCYGTHTMRRTKPTLIYKRTKNLRAVQLLLGHSKIESTVRYLGIEVDDALEMAEQTEV